MAENKMEQVAKLFGKKLGEEFKIRYKDFSSRGVYEDVTRKAYFTEKGLYVCWFKSHKSAILTGLLMGETEIVEDEE